MHVQVVPFAIHRVILYLALSDYVQRRLKKRLNDSKHHSFDKGDHRLL